MEHSIVRKAGGHTDGQGISRCSWTPNVHCRDHNSSPALSQINPVCIFETCFLKINFNIFLQSAPRSERSLSLRFPAKTVCTFLISPCASYVTAAILFDFIILITFYEEYKLWSCLLYGFMLHRNFLLRILFSNTINLCFVP